MRPCRSTGRTPGSEPGDRGSNPRAVTTPPHLQWLAAVEQHGVNLTPFEQQFIKSIRRQVNAGYALSGDQINKLEQIYAERTP